MIQAMIWSLVPTSGPGMSFSGPMMMEISEAKTARKALQLPGGERVGVHGHAPLGAAVGDVHHGALPRHPHGQGSDLVQVHGGVIADAALGRASGQAVLDAVAGEDAHAPVVHVDGKVHGQLSPWGAQDAAQAVVQVQPVGYRVELGQCGGIGRGLRNISRHLLHHGSSLASVGPALACRCLVRGDLKHKTPPLLSLRAAPIRIIASLRTSTIAIARTGRQRGDECAAPSSLPYNRGTGETTRRKDAWLPE